jgi:hypothetical protein
LGARQPGGDREGRRSRPQGQELRLVQLDRLRGFREGYPQSVFDKVQYETWTQGLDFTPEMKRKDNELPDPLRALVRPGDNEFNELALQTAFIGTQMPLELSRKRIEVVVLTGIHLDWCIEGNARAARDHGYLPIVIGDACGCQKPEQEAAAYGAYQQLLRARDLVRHLRAAPGERQQARVSGVGALLGPASPCRRGGPPRSGRCRLAGFRQRQGRGRLARPFPCQDRLIPPAAGGDR